ncbi:MAG: alpha/beta fold hydrolase [Aquincola tertiaricarbonis]|uniref:alpha/beta fold hydrolase n=1 Tax=Aquincola tertiaricarbonis TaxID=391953 RepID=UPI000614B939|nr:alpha/beta hydrolase family protein [Aquincola tertiaricarbonis]
MDYVLVHGAWHGAWCWKRVLPGLWAAGHRAFAVSLTGVGERAHQFRRDIDLKTHADDVCTVIEAEELQGAVLVGHSYGGIVITAVADRLAHRMSHLVYLDAVVPEPGESWSSGHSAETQAARRAAIAATGAIAPADPAAFGLTGGDAAWVARRQTPQPGGVYDDPLHFDAQRIAALPRTFIDCTSPALPTIDLMRQRVRKAAGWKVVEIPTGHDPMVSAPDQLLAALLAVRS